MEGWKVMFDVDITFIEYEDAFSIQNNERKSIAFSNCDEVKIANGLLIITQSKNYTHYNLETIFSFVIVEKEKENN
jgi:hypothetical protein